MKHLRTIWVPSSKFWLLNRRRAKVLWKFLFAGSYCGAQESSPSPTHPLTRTFAEQTCLVTAKDSTLAARHEDRCIRTKIQRSHKTARECSRNRKHSLFFSALLIENSKDFKRAAALLLGCAAAQQLSRNFFLAARHHSSLRS